MTLPPQEIFPFLLSVLYSSPSHASQRRTWWSSTCQVSGRWSYIISPISGKEIVHDPNFHFFSSILLLSKDGVISFCSWGVKRGCDLSQHPSLWLSLSTALSCSVSWCYIHSSCTADRHQNVQRVLNNSGNISVKDTAVFLMLSSFSHPQRGDQEESIRQLALADWLL